MRITKRVGAALAVALLLLGVPGALLAWGHPETLLQVDWSTALTRPDDGRVFLGLLAVLAWVAWLVVAATTIGELASALSRGAVSIRLPGTAWLRPMVGALVAAALTPVVAVGMPTDMATPSLAAVFDVEAAADEGPDEAGPESSPAVSAATSATYVVQPGDELWSLAEQFLGSGEKWPIIVAANPGLSHERRLVAGERLVMPLPAEPAAASTAAPEPVAEEPVADSETTSEAAPVFVVVERGDTLWDLAAQHLGDPERWPEIFEANRDQIADPDQIDIGWRLAVPVPVVEPVAPAPAEEAEAPAPSGPSGNEATPSTSLPAADSSPTTESAQVPAAIPTPTSAASPTPTVQPATVATEPAAEASPGRAASGPHRAALSAVDSPARELLGPVGAVLAAGIFAGVAVRRRLQLAQRPLGRRLPPLEAGEQRYWTSLGRVAAEHGPEPDARPTEIVLGWVDDEPLPLDLEEARATWIESADPELATGMVAAALTSLACADWSAGVEVVVVEPEDDWETALDDPRIRCIASLEEALAELQALCARRRIEMGSSGLPTLRRDPDLADAWAPVVFVLSQPVEAEAIEGVRRQLSLGQVGVSVVGSIAPAAVLPTDCHGIRIDAEDDATTLHDGVRFTPQLLPAPARRAVVGLFRASSAADTEPAPWWDDTPLPPNVKVLPSTKSEPPEDLDMSSWPGASPQPTLLLLGPVDLLGYQGIVPARSVTASLECCAWLLDHPGATPSRMLADMVIADTTRRSNLSRLRAWLGNDADGEPYLPDGYSGQLELHPDVTSDWERFRLLLAGGVNQASTPVLRQALGMVRGAPLAGVDFQWPWADQMRMDMVGMVTDAGAVLCDRALEQGDVVTARWAIDQAKLAAADDELIGVRDIQLLAFEGDTAGLDQAVRRVTRAARVAGRDLAPESVQRIQQALHVSVAGQTAT